MSAPGPSKALLNMLASPLEEGRDGCQQGLWREPPRTPAPNVAPQLEGGTARPRTAGSGRCWGQFTGGGEIPFVPLVACHPERLCQPQLLQSLGLAPWALWMGEMGPPPPGDP